jgi:hypothetical protein
MDVRPSNLHAHVRGGGLAGSSCTVALLAMTQQAHYYIHRPAAQNCAGARGAAQASDALLMPASRITRFDPPG